MSRLHETTSNRISIHIWHPTIKGTQVKSKEQLHEIINTKYPGIKINPDFPNLLYDAEIHLDIIRRLEAKNNIEIDTRNLLFDEFDITYKKMTTWTQAARQPRLYYLIDNSIPKTEAQESIRKINQENNGLCSSNDVLKRLEPIIPLKLLPNQISIIEGLNKSTSTSKFLNNSKMEVFIQILPAKPMFQKALHNNGAKIELDLT
ncbi:MAG: hypothetical protein ACFE8O_04855 [Candidatus Hermodarchaeota archaeon]